MLAPPVTLSFPAYRHSSESVQSKEPRHSENKSAPRLHVYVCLSIILHGGSGKTSPLDFTGVSEDKLDLEKLNLTSTPLPPWGTRAVPELGHMTNYPHRPLFTRAVPEIRH